MSRPASLFIVTPPTAGGGLERSTATLIHGFDRTVVKPILVLTHSRADNARLVATIPDDVEVIELNKTGFADQLRVVRRLRQLYDERRPDVVMGRATWAGVLAMLARRGSRHSPSIMLTEHVTPELIHQPRNRWLLWMARRLFPRAEALVGVGAGVAAAAAQAFGVPPRRVHVIENSYDPFADEVLAGTDPLGPPFDGDVPVVLFVGRLSPEKGVDDLIAAMAIVRRSVPARLLIVGDGPERGRLEQLAHSTGVTDAVEFAGYVVRPYRQMAAADVMVAPSHFEAFSVVMLEALRAGAALIAADCDWGPREILSHGRNGLLVPVRDPGALGTAIVRVLNDPELAQNLRREARASSERYTPERNVSAHEALIVKLVKRRAG